VYVFLRLLSPRGHGIIVGAVLAFALFFSMVGTLLAGTTGTISGTVTNARGNQGLSGVKVSAFSPTGHYSANSDSKGFFSIIGVSPDTYTVSFELAGYQPVSVTGVNVFPDQVADLTSNAVLSKSLVTIGRVTSRSTTGAFQPGQTADSYTISSSQIATNLGKSYNSAESTLLVTLPGVSLDRSGYPVIRGGRENEESYQYEGIPYTDAFSNQFINSLAFNSGIAQAQLTPGAGDASTTSAGTGTINLISKRGSSPAFGSLDLEMLNWPYTHQAGFDYGFASPDGRFSNYVSYVGSTATQGGSTYGLHGSNLTNLGLFFTGRSYQELRDLSDNFIYKFGNNQNQSLQFFWENEVLNFEFNAGGWSQLCPSSCDPYTLNTYLPGVYLPGLSAAQIQQIIPLTPGQTSATANFTSTPYSSAQPNDTFKVQYNNNLNASTFFTAKFFSTNGGLIEPALFTGEPNEDLLFVQGGQQKGVTADITKQINSQNLLKVGTSYSWVHPIDTVESAFLGLIGTVSPFVSPGVEGGDFLGTNPYTGSTWFLNGNGATAAGGYTNGTAFFPNGIPRLPYFLQNPTVNRQEWSTYFNDTFSPTDRVKFDLGMRLEGANFQFPSAAPCNVYSAASVAAGIANVGTPWSVDAASGANQCLYAYNAFDASGNPIVNVPSAAVHPLIPEPRGALSFQIGRNDAVRFSYGRTEELPSNGSVDARVGRGYYDNAFGFAPDPFSGNVCGISQSNPCSSFGEQLYWDNQMNVNGIPIEPAQPETFNNYDFSYSHQFPAGIGMKITPFYRRGYNAIANVSSVLLDKSGNPLTDPITGAIEFGPSLTTNLGMEKTTGLEFLLTRDVAYGLTGEFELTYLNELSNVVPLSSSEDFFPTIPGASLALGNLYRAGFLSPLQGTLALGYKMHSGWKINPIVTYNHGYPIGNGTIGQIFIGKTAYNVPATNATVNGQTTFSGGSTGSMQYVDPMNPGSVFKPNIDATRGGALTPSAGGALTASRFATNLDIEFSPPGSHNTFGVLVTNLFGNIYGQPAVNSRWQPVATGIGGPRTGYTTNAANGFNAGFCCGFFNYFPQMFQYDPFVVVPSGSLPTFRLYYQANL
jgi:hypothetical protein